MNPLRVTIHSLRTYGKRWLLLGNTAASMAANFVLHTPRNLGVTLLHLHHMRHVVQSLGIKSGRWNRQKCYEWLVRQRRWRRAMLGACLISWHQESISDEELQQTIESVENATGERFCSHELTKSREEPTENKENSIPSSDEEQEPQGNAYSSKESRNNRKVRLMWERIYEVEPAWLTEPELESQSIAKSSKSSSPTNHHQRQNDYRTCDQADDPQPTQHQQVIRAKMQFMADEDASWELVLDNGAWCRMWRRPSRRYAHLYEYLVRGSFEDISAHAFFEVQRNLEYRPTWDKDVISLRTVDSHGPTELVQWIVHFPYRMAPREYLYVRRAEMRPDDGLFVIISRAVNTPHAVSPAADAKVLTQTPIRVTEYESNMIIKPHDSIDEPGFDYFLLYCDNPRANFQKLFYNWAATTAVPNLLQQVHHAAKHLEATGWLQRQAAEAPHQAVVPSSPISSTEATDNVLSGEQTPAAPASIKSSSGTSEQQKESETQESILFT